MVDNWPQSHSLGAMTCADTGMRVSKFMSTAMGSFDNSSSNLSNSTERPMKFGRVVYPFGGVNLEKHWSRNGGQRDKLYMQRLEWKCSFL